MKASSVGKKQIIKKNKIAPGFFLLRKKRFIFSVSREIPEFLFSQKKVGIFIFFIKKKLSRYLYDIC